MLRKSFTVTADDYDLHGHDSLIFCVDVVSLGYHEVYVNGTRVGDYVMQPAVSQLDKRALQVTYDITSLVHVGENEIMIWIGQGWGRIYGTAAAVKASVYRSLSSWCQELVSVYSETDSTWEVSPSGYSYTGNWQPMQFGGERYDARVKPDWRPASVCKEATDFGGRVTNLNDITISRQEFKGNRIVDTLSPISETLQSDGSILLDFGRVVTGWFQTDFAQLGEDQDVTMEYLDHIDAKPPFTETDVYIARGSGKEFFTNRFHTHAFRYVRIRGLNSHDPLRDAKGYHVALQISAVDPMGGATFECSDPRLNAIHDMVKYTLSCLTFSGYMVDCPHIERMGYGGDGNSSTMTLQTIWDVRDTYRNWLTAWGDAMDSTGDLPYVAPAFRTGGGPYWSGFIIKAPYRIWQNYGDNYLMVENFEKMKRWLGFVEKHCEDGILKPWPDTERRGWFLGDWAVPEGVDKGGESVLHVSNCFLTECLGDMVEMANSMGRIADTQYYTEWRQRLKAAIHRNFYHPETYTYANGTPLDQAYALLMNIPPDSVTRQAVKEQLIKDCHDKYRDHIAVGLVGVPVFTEWCIRERQADLMATCLRQPDYPGYLNIIENSKLKIENSPGAAANSGTQASSPATQFSTSTTWESWDCGREGKEDRSRVHNCYNGIGIWFYQALAGIRPDPKAPGYKHFFIDPQPVDDIEWVRATKPTPYGDITVEIKAKELKVIVPEGTTATLFPGTPYQCTLEAGVWSARVPAGIAGK